MVREWRELSPAEKAEVIKYSIQNGVSSLKLIRDTYSLYTKDTENHLYGFGDFIKSLFNKTEEPVVELQQLQQPQPLDLLELAVRLAYTESSLNPNISNDLKATGLYLIRPIALLDFNNRAGKNYSMEDMLNVDKNIEVRNFLMNFYLDRDWNTKNNPSDSILFAKSLGAFNMGAKNLVNRLNTAKSKGVDIYNSWDWIPYLPKEAQDYINFTLRNLDNSIQRNNTAYDSISALKPELVGKIKESVKSTGGPISFNFEPNNKEYKPGIYEPFISIDPNKLNPTLYKVYDAAKRTGDYVKRLQLAVALVVPVLGTIFDIATADKTTNTGNAINYTGLISKNPVMRGLGKSISVGDTVDDALEVYNALFNRPPEKKIAPYIDEWIDKRSKFIKKNT